LEKNVGTAISKLLISEELLPYSTVFIEGNPSGGIKYRIQAGKPPRNRSKSPVAQVKTPRAPTVEDIDEMRD